MTESNLKTLDSALFTWFQQKCSEGVPISGNMISKQAQIFHKKLNYPGSFVASNGWLQRFKARHGIRELKIQGKKLSGDTDAVECFKKEFEQIVERHQLTPSQIYNADETGLNWKCLPTKTLAAASERSAPGYKSSKERITILYCANSSGEHKLKLTTIGKAKNPRSFKGTKVKFLPVNYYNNKSAWMTQDIFKNWFHSKLVPDVSEFLKSKGLPRKLYCSWTMPPLIPFKVG